MLVSKLPEGRTIVLKRVQLEKAPAPIVVRELGKTIVAREELLKNAPDPIVCSLLFEAKVDTLLRRKNPEKVFDASCSKESGRTMDVSDPDNGPTSVDSASELEYLLFASNTMLAIGVWTNT